MFEVGKCYAQFSVDYGERCVFVDKILSITDNGIGLSGFTIEEDGIYYEEASYAGDFDEENYIEIPQEHFEELTLLMNEKCLCENVEIAQQQIAKYEKLCNAF